MNEKRLAQIKEAQAWVGLCLAVIQEVEFYLANAWFLGLTEKDRQSQRTLGDLIEIRNRLTLGQLVKKFKEGWELEPEFERLLDFFVTQRNRFAHSLLMEGGCGFMHARERKRLTSMLSVFFEEAIFRGGYLITLKIGASFAPPEISASITNFDLKDQDHIDWFRSVCHYRGSNRTVEQALGSGAPPGPRGVA